MSMEQASKRCNALETSHAWPSPARDTSGAAWAGVQNWMERASTAAAAAASSTRLPSCRGTPLGTPNGGSHALNGRCAAQQHRTEPANVRAAGPHREPGGAHPVEGRRGRGSFGAMPWMPWSPAQRPLPEAHRASHSPVVPSASGAPRTVGGMPGGGNWNMPCHGRPLSLATLPHHHHLVVLFYILDRPRPGLETFLCPSTLSPFGLALRDLPSSSSLLLALCAATPHDTARLHAHQHPRPPDAHGLDHATACLTASSSQRETSPLHAVGGTAEGGCRFHSAPSAH